MRPLLELADRCEQATGPDVMLDIAIHHATKHGTTTVPPFTECIDAAMLLVPSGLELAIYTNWPLVEQYEPRNDDGSWTVKESTPRGCWTRTYGASESGSTKNVSARAHSIALALCAAALRARGSA